jgi:hypothetical protein
MDQSKFLFSKMYSNVQHFSTSQNENAMDCMLGAKRINFDLTNYG